MDTKFEAVNFSVYAYVYLYTDINIHATKITALYF